MTPELRKVNVLLLTRADVKARAARDRRGDQGRLRAGQGEIQHPREAPRPAAGVPRQGGGGKGLRGARKAKNFNEAVAKLGFKESDIDLGLLARKDMIDPKIADAAFGLKKDELSKPVEGQFSIVLVRVSEIVPASSAPSTRSRARSGTGSPRSAPARRSRRCTRRSRTSARPASRSRRSASSLKLPFREIAEIDRAARPPTASRRSSTPRPPRSRRPRSPAAAGLEAGGHRPRRRRLCLGRRARRHAGEAENLRGGEGGGQGRRHRSRAAQGGRRLRRQAGRAPGQGRDLGSARQGDRRQGREDAPP